MHTSVFEHTNETDTRVVVYVEPWCTEVELAPNGSCRIEFHARIDGEHVVEWCDGYLIVWAWPTATTRIYVDGVLKFDIDLEVPPIP